MKFPFPFQATEITIATTTSATSSWPWPSCANNPKTLSFRANTNDNTYKTMNSAYLDDENTREFADNESFFSISNTFQHYDEEIKLEISNFEQTNYVEPAVVSGLMSDRLFFEPAETSSILEEAKLHDHCSHKAKATIIEMDSSDPFLDFRVSMEEMVEAHDLKDWECLEELLECYLRVNDTRNHGYIVGAFVDLLIHLALISASDNDSAIDAKCSSSSTTKYSLTSPLSFSSTTCSSFSPCLSSLEKGDEIVIEKNTDSSSLSSSSLLPLYNAPSSGV